MNYLKEKGKKIKRKEDPRDGVPSKTFRDTRSIMMGYQCVKCPLPDNDFFCLTSFDGHNKVNAFKTAV